jgi:hypothetical protein
MGFPGSCRTLFLEYNHPSADKSLQHGTVKTESTELESVEKRLGDV